jgi:16S rRNA (guanine(1405)-N(7))-methyltransferase
LARIDPATFVAMIEKTQTSAKYRALDLPRELLEDILSQEASLSQNTTDLERRFREKLHNIIAPYLEEINYPLETEKLQHFATTKPDREGWKSYCSTLMARHASMRERLPYLEPFAAFLNPYIQQSKIVLDLACALDPLILPWLEINVQPELLCYDIQSPRIDFLNHFFKAFYPTGIAIRQDVLADPPKENADLAIFLKEAHRFEKRRPGCNRAFFQALPAKILIISLPAQDLAGKHSLEAYHSRLIAEATAGLGWDCSKTCIGNELIFVIKKDELK